MDGESEREEGEGEEEEEEGTRDGGLPRRPSPSLPRWLLSGPALAWPPDGFLLVASASAVSAPICVRLPTTTARQLERKHLTSSACLLFLPSLHICTCKGLLRLIWRFTGWLASMYYHNSKKIFLRIKLKDDFGLLLYVFFLRMIKD